MRLSARCLDGVAFVSDAVAGAWERQTLSGRRAVIHNGLVDHVAARSRSDKLRIGFLGMNGARKGFDIIAQWVTASKPHDLRWQFYGDLHPDLVGSVARLASSNKDSVVLCGRRPAREIFNEIDVLVHASTEFDSFPTVLLEAARAGIPAVASDVGGSREIVLHGATGFLFDPNAPESGLGLLATLANDPGRREAMGRAARARYEEQFEISQMVSGYTTFWGAAHQRSRARAS